MKSRIFLSVVACCMGAQAAWGNSTPRRETNYNIQSSAVEVVTTAKRTNQFDEKMTNYLLPLVRDALRGTQFVTDIQAVEGAEQREEIQWADYVTHKRVSKIFVNMQLPSRVSMLFNVEEDYRRCRVPQQLPPGAGSRHMEDDAGAGAIQQGCQLQSTLKLTGPLAIYGTYTSAINVDRLLQGKQDLQITLAKSWDKADAVFTTRLNVSSMQWEDNLQSFMKAFNIRPQTDQADVTTNGSSPNVLLSRQTIFLGVARFARQINERILQ